MDGYEKRLLALEKETAQLREQIRAVNGTLHEFCTAFGEICTQIQGITEQNYSLSVRMLRAEAIANNLKYEICDPADYKNDFFYPRFRSNEETLRLITQEGKSLARFGDGEFSIAFKISRQEFQRVDDRLAERIWGVVNSSHPNLLIGIADNYGCLDKYSDQGANGIRLYMTEETRKQHQQILSADRIYSDAYITRPYVLYRDVFTEGPRKRFDALKKIWENKKILIVEGAQTRLGVGNDLFSGACSVERILAPATSSFDRYDDILKECLMYGGRVDLFLLAIGPSSGVLAYDLTVKGFQAVDVGHIDLEYEWFLAGKGMRVSVPYKYNNEVEGGNAVEHVHDAAYEASVVASFTNT